MDTRDMLADGLTKGGVDRTLLHRVSNNCQYKAAYECAVHLKASVNGSATKPSNSAPRRDPAEEEDEVALEGGRP